MNQAEISKIQTETVEKIKEIKELYDHDKFVQKNYIEKLKNEMKIKE